MVRMLGQGDALSAYIQLCQCHDVDVSHVSTDDECPEVRLWDLGIVYQCSESPDRLPWTVEILDEIPCGSIIQAGERAIRLKAIYSRPPVHRCGLWDRICAASYVWV